MKLLKKGILSLVLIILTTLLISCEKDQTLSKNFYVNRMQLKSENELSSLLKENNPVRHKGIYNVTFETNFGAVPTNDAQEERQYIETNVQVENVDEADVIKTDGNNIYYRNPNNGGLYWFIVLKDGTIELHKSIVEENSYINELYLSDEYLITIGNINSSSIKHYFYFNYYFYSKGFVRVYNKATLQLTYELIVDNSFSFHRLVDNKLFLIYNHYIYEDKLTPSFTETINGNENVYNLDYENIYYFDKEKVYNMAVYNVLNLDSFNLKSEAYLGYVENIYMNDENLYSTSSSYDFKTNQTTTEILKFSIDNNENDFKYLAKGKIKGSILNSYSLDEYNNYLRVVSTSWSPITNYLTVLKESSTEDSLITVGLLSEGLGKKDETVKSVRFLNDLAYVVTFRQIDPLYTIDLKDPNNPTIINAIEEPGYSTYLHSWDDLGHIIGLGLNATTEGIVNGLKLSAYKDDQENPLQSYIFSKDSPFSWNYSEAVYNPRAILISSEINIIGFPLSSSGFTVDQQYIYSSQYVIFKIDFTNYNQIISQPIIIDHPSTNDYVAVERGIYIKGSTFEIVFTFSNLMVVSYDLINDKTVQQLLIK